MEKIKKILSSPRFWGMTLAIVGHFLDGDISIGQALMEFGAGFTGVGTFDRMVDKFSKKTSKIPNELKDV